MYLRSLTIPDIDVTGRGENRLVILSPVDIHLLTRVHNNAEGSNEAYKFRLPDRIADP
jgi:hypothetical protein